MFVWKVVCSVRIPGAGTAARWRTASAPARHSTVWPKSVRSASRDAAGDSAGGTTSTASTSCSCSSRSRTTARPAFPLAPVTTILDKARSLRTRRRRFSEIAAGHATPGKHAHADTNAAAAEGGDPQGCEYEARVWGGGLAARETADPLCDEPDGRG